MIKFPRILAAGLLGGLAMMVVAFLLHRPPLDEIGWINLPDSAHVRSTLSTAIGDRPGLYVYPSIVGSASGDGGAIDRGPSGLLIYQPAGSEMSFAQSMAEEALKTILMATLAAFLLACVRSDFGYGARAGFIAAIGAMTSVSTHVSDHLWFGFPLSYTIGRIGLDFGPWIVASLVIAALVRPRLGGVRE